MDTFLGLILMILFIVCVIVLAAAVTWVVVKVSPSRTPESSPPQS